MISYPLAVNGVLTRVLESGSAGLPVVLVHGTGGRADRWIRNLDEFNRTLIDFLKAHG